MFLSGTSVPIPSDTIAVGCIILSQLKVSKTDR